MTCVYCRYYEVEIVTRGSIQIGWMLCDSCPGDFVGSSSHSYAFDGMLVCMKIAKFSSSLIDECTDIYYQTCMAGEIYTRFQHIAFLPYIYIYLNM